MAEQRQCGECGLCCKVVAIPELDSARGEWCRHYLPRKGCGIHATRPDVCRAFFCAWITHSEFDEQWRPDKAGFFMWEQPVPNGRRLMLEVDADRQEPWRREPYWSALRSIAQRAPGLPHVEIFLRTAQRLQVLFPEGVIDLGPHRELAIETGYARTAGGVRPYARYVEG